MRSSISEHTELEKLVYTIQTKIGIYPKWERELVNGDEKLKIYKEPNDKGICSKLYYLRINFLKGWMQKL